MPGIYASLYFLSLSSFYQKCQDESCTVLIVKTADNEVSADHMLRSYILFYRF